jgi:hypothetical protein
MMTRLLLFHQTQDTIAYQVSRRVLEMILPLKEKGGTTTWWPP